MTFIGWGLIITGLFIIFSGIVGMLRFPNFYTKIHAAGVIDACGIPMSLVGLACLQQEWINSFKLLFAAILILLLSPVATQALAKAALRKNNENSIQHKGKKEKANG